MASIFTLATGTMDPAVDRSIVAVVSTPHECAHCRSLIVSGQRWVREKVYEPSTNNSPHYRRYHVDLFVDQELSCWEKHEMELEIARAVRTAHRIM
jgi:hypothetical protein